MRRVLYALTWAGMVLAAGCGGSASTGSPAVMNAGEARDGSQAGAEAGTATPGAVEPARSNGPGKPTEAECQVLLDHFLSLAQAAHAAKVAAELVPTPEQVADIRARLAPTYIPACLSMDRATYECERAATNLEQQLACSAEAGAQPGAP